MICCLYHYTHKEAILHKAWEMGTVDFDGPKVKIWPDISQATVQRRPPLRPVLNRVRQLGHTYRWGFTLRLQSDLTDLFAFLGAKPFSIPYWLQLFLQAPGRSGTLLSFPGLPPHQPRARSRSKALTPDGPRGS